MDEYECLLVAKGIRSTAIRLLVLRRIMGFDSPFTLANAEAILETVERSTLFRTLRLFLSAHLLTEVDNGCGAKLYCVDAVAGGGAGVGHVHFTCLRCGRTFCLRDIDAYILRRPKGFVVDEVSCVMKGVCPDCQ